MNRYPDSAALRLALAFAFVLALGVGLAACVAPESEAPAEPASSAAEEEPEADDESASDAQAMAGDPAHGEELFTVCAACHGQDGEGVEGLGKELRGNEFIAGLSDEEAVAFLKVGRPSGHELNTTGIDMPPKGGNPALGDEDLYDIVAYVRSLE